MTRMTREPRVYGLRSEIKTTDYRIQSGDKSKSSWKKQNFTESTSRFKIEPLDLKDRDKYQRKRSGKSKLEKERRLEEYQRYGISPKDRKQRDSREERANKENILRPTKTLNMRADYGYPKYKQSSTMSKSARGTVGLQNIGNTCYM